MAVIIGTSGWQYKDWRDVFYPKGVPQRLWLEHYAESFATVESNNAFYMLPKPETFAAWARRTPEDFVMAVKVSRYLTHIRRLRDPSEPVQRFLEHAKHLGSKLGPVLLQLPPNLKSDLGNLDQTLTRFGNRARVAVEFRHESWFNDETKALLEQHGAALCLTDRGSRPNSPLWRTAAWTYLRFHWGTGSPESCYGRTALDSWTGRLAERWTPEEDIFVYFNNDPNGCAIRDAGTFGRLVDARGYEPTRVPRSVARLD